jgi:hypothetical protein
MDEIKSFIGFIVEHIVDIPEEVNVSIDDGVNGGVLVSILCAKSDMGLVVGKQGHTVNALRDILNVVGRKNGLYTTLVLREPEIGCNSIAEDKETDLSFLKEGV